MMRIDDGEQETETDVMVETVVTVTVAHPDSAWFCVDVATTSTVSACAGVNTPALLTVPMFAGGIKPVAADLSDQVTAEL